MWKPVVYSLGLSGLIWFACVMLAPVTDTLSLLPIFPGFLLGVAVVGMYEHPSRNQDLAFATVWLATTITMYAPVIYGLLTAERFFGRSHGLALRQRRE